MSIETESTHITPTGGNVFADLGFGPDEAAVLKAESQQIIAETLAGKADSVRDAVGRMLAAPRFLCRCEWNTLAAAPDAERPGPGGDE